MPWYEGNNIPVYKECKLDWLLEIFTFLCILDDVDSDGDGITDVMDDDDDNDGLLDIGFLNIIFKHFEIIC